MTAKNAERLLEQSFNPYVFHDQTNWDYWALHPFINPDHQFIQERAYFHAENRDWEKCDEPLENWLLAEQEETIREIHACQFLARRYDAYESENVPFIPFWQLYRPLAKFSYIYNTPKRNDLVGLPEKKCVFCGETNPKMFRDEAHVIPQSLGNNWVFTLNECDKCNKGFGRQYENELGNMLQVERALGGGYKKGGGTVKAKYGKSEAYIGGQARDAALEVQLVEGDPTVRFEIIDSNTKRFTVRMPSYSPLRAIKSLAKSAYLAIPPERQPNYADLKTWLVDVNDQRPSSLWRIFVPGPGHMRVGMGLWKAREENKEFSQLIALFQTGNYILVWHLPQLAAGSLYPTEFLPDVALSPYFPFEPHFQREEWHKDARVSRKTLSMDFKHT